MKSAFQCKVPFRSHWWDNFFRQKKWMLDSKFFTFLKPKNDLLVQFLDPVFFRAEGPIIFFGPQKN